MLTTKDGVAYDQLRVQIRDHKTDALIASRLTNGNGYVAFVDLQPGKYRVLVVDDARVTEMKVDNIKVAAGAVERASIAVSPKKLEAKKQPHETTPTHVPQEDPDAVEEMPNGWR